MLSGKISIYFIEAEFGRSIYELFYSFDSTHIAAAILVQVHPAVVDGEYVEENIQDSGPYLKHVIDLDDRSETVTAVKQFQKHVGRPEKDLNAF